MLAQFSVRFVIAVFGGAAVGLLVGLVGTYVFDADWNPFAMMPWGIMAGAIGLSFSMVPLSGSPKGAGEREDPPVG